MRFAVESVLFLLSVTAHADSLKDFNKSLSDFNHALSKGNQTSRQQPQPAQRSPNVAAITPEQQEKIAQALEKRITDARIKAMIAEASPTIKAFVERFSCIVDSNGGGSLNIYAAPGIGFDNTFPPMVFTRYHNKAVCLTVTRIHGWTAPALNVLTFEVVYLAEDSGESTKTRHKIVKQPDGDWLFGR